MLEVLFQLVHFANLILQNVNASLILKCDIGCPCIAFIKDSLCMCAYICVVSILECPSNICNNLISTPDLYNIVAKLCLNE